eukprot:878404-Prymnesium_polylepis.1
MLAVGALSGRMVVMGLNGHARLEDAPPQQFLASDFHQLLFDAHRNAIDQTAQARAPPVIECARIARARH